MEDIFSIISQKADAYGDFTAQILSRLVRIKSLSMGEEAVQDELMRMMQETGFDEVRRDGLGNVIGRMGNGRRVLAIDGHMDTVDAGNMANWAFSPFEGIIGNGFVKGRGTVDQKGGIAAALTAARILHETGFPEDVTLLVVGSVMEEDCDGLCWKYLIEEEKIRPDLVISSEPTNLNIYRGQRGRMEIEVEFHGVSCHGSAPERGDNAIYKAARAALAIEHLNHNLPADPFLGKGSVTISEIRSGSPSLCAVADYAAFHLDRRLTRGESRESALEGIRDLVEPMGGFVRLLRYEETAYTGQRYGMDKYYPTWSIPADHEAVIQASEAYRRLFGKEPLVDKWTFSTNGVTINGVYGIPVIGFGPGDEVLAHAPNEMVPIRDLVVASAFYAGFVQVFSKL